jgi:hypothetical protein
MATMSLARALKLKNRRIQRVKELGQLIESSNRYIEGSEPDFDAKRLLSQLFDETERLWMLKATINAANAPVHTAIYELAELKGRVVFLKGLNTQRGKAVDMYSMQVPQEYEATITAVDALEMIRDSERRIDELQDLLDAHNAMTTIEVDSELSGD